MSRATTMPLLAAGAPADDPFSSHHYNASPTRSFSLSLSLSPEAKVTHTFATACYAFFMLRYTVGRCSSELCERVAPNCTTYSHGFRRLWSDPFPPTTPAREGALVQALVVAVIPPVTKPPSTVTVSLCVCVFCLGYLFCFDLLSAHLHRRVSQGNRNQDADCIRTVPLQENGTVQGRPGDNVSHIAPRICYRHRADDRHEPAHQPCKRRVLTVPNLSAFGWRSPRSPPAPVWETSR